jgi:hypothetical protein
MNTVINYSLIGRTSNHLPGRANTSYPLRVGKNPGFFKKNQPGGFFWVLLGFIGFFGFFWVLLNFRLFTDIFLPIFGRYNFFISKKYLKLSTKIICQLCLPLEIF